MSDPICCGEPMVSYQAGTFWECSASYFRLFDDGMVYDDGCSPPSLIEPDEYHVDLRRMPTEFHQALYAHLLETRIMPDDTEASA